MPITATYCQNFELSGIVTLIEQVYIDLLKSNHRLRREIPLSVFQHYITTKLDAVVVDRIKETRQNDLFTGQWARDLFFEDTLIPGPIHDYISYYADEILTTGNKLVVNVPDVAVPRGPIIFKDEIIAPSGSFGVVDAETHNVYEAYLSPLVTSRMVLNELRDPGTPVLPPLTLSIFVMEKYNRRQGHSGFDRRNAYDREDGEIPSGSTRGSRNQFRAFTSFHTFHAPPAKFIKSGNVQHFGDAFCEFYVVSEYVPFSDLVREVSDDPFSFFQVTRTPRAAGEVTFTPNIKKAEPKKTSANSILPSPSPILQVHAPLETKSQRTPKLKLHSSVERLHDGMDGETHTITAIPAG